MGDGKALQMWTSHELCQNFAKAFGITYSNAEGTAEHVWQTSWGASTRLIGALVMGHGDDFGLRLPPALAPTQVVVLMIKEEEGVRAAAESLVAALRAAGHRVRLDDRVETSFGRRSVAWELKGVPVRVEIGPRDLDDGQVTVVMAIGTSGRSGPRPSRRRVTRWPPSSGGSVPSSSPKPWRGGSPARPRWARWKRPSKPPSVGSPGSPWPRSGPTGRTGWPPRP